jgi:hypothetical protein
MMQLDSKEQNEYAKDIRGLEVYILDVESGQKNYWCIGCGHEMQAIHRTIIGYKPYFRHVAKEVSTERKCTFSNQEYRHKLAIAIIQESKRIKVPNLYKYAPDGKKKVLLRDSEFIEASYVKAELTFYEDDNGEVLHGKNPLLGNKNLLIRPDITFFNIHNEPILLIEIVVTHKLDIEKIVKLKRLGINTIQIIIPKDSEENIAKNLQTSNNTKWVYNDIEERTEYLHVSKGVREDISPIDELQRKFFEESVICRTAQIKNLIRTIKRSLETESYKRIEFQFESEISRIKVATKEHQSRLDEIQAGIEREIHSELGERRGELDKRSNKFQEYRSDLEGRYYNKRFSIIEKRRDIDREIEFRYGIGKSEEDIRREFERIERCLVEEEADIDSELEGIRIDEASILREVEECSTFENDFGGKEDALGKEFDKLEESEQKNFERETEKLGSKIKGIRKSRTEFENGLRSEFEGRFEQITERINNKDIQGRDELSERIETILNLRGLLGGYTKGEETLEKCRKGIEIIKDGTWKKWN